MLELSLKPSIHLDIKVHSFIQMLESQRPFPSSPDAHHICCIEAEMVRGLLIKSAWFLGDDSAAER